jgi:hypothetical protein
VKINGLSKGTYVIACESTSDITGTA